MTTLSHDSTIAFLGGGNMAASLIGGLLSAGHAAENLRVAVRGAESVERLRLRFGVAATTQLSDCVAGAGIVVLAVKPQQAADVLRGLQLAPGAVLISVAAGLRIETLRRWLGAAPTIVRAMPNTPALFGAGVTGAYLPPEAPATAKAQADALLRTAGATCWVEREELIDAVTALSGSGPAYYFLLTEILAEAGVSLGLDAATAEQLARLTFTGAATMLSETGIDAATLRAQVTSKGGTTEAAVAALESADLRRIFQTALVAAVDRARLRGDELAAQP